MPTWRNLGQQLESTVDAQYGEAVDLLPYYKTAYMNAYIPDPTRAAGTGIGVVVGRGTFLRAAGNASFIQKRAEADLLISLLDQYWTAIPIRAHDRIKLKERNDMLCEVSYIELGMNGRSVFHLLRTG